MLNSPGLDWNLLVAFAAAWLLTYAIHSTLLLGAVWGLGRRSILSPALQDTLWKVALVGGLLTAGWQTAGLGHAPLGGRLEVTAPVSAPAPGPGESPVFTTAGRSGSGAVFFGTPESAPDAPSPAAGHRAPWELWMLGVWGAGALLGLLRLGWARFRLARLLGARRPLASGPLRRTLDRLCREAGITRPIRLSTSDRIGGPVALAGREICLPRRAVTDLDPEQQQNALAHELAHLIRRDPAWRWLSALVEHVFFFQPLNRVARRGLKDSAEFLCDDWAVTQTGQHLTLAKCLVEVAGWLDPRPEVVHAAGMAEPGSPLVRRVERLLGVRAAREIPAVWRVAGATALLTLVMALAPVVTAVHERPEPAAETASFGWTPAGDGLRPAAPFRFQGVGSGSAASGTAAVSPGPTPAPAPPSPPGEGFEAFPVAPTPEFAPRAGAPAAPRSRRVVRREARHLSEAMVVVDGSAPQPAMVWTWEVPAAPFRGKLAALRAVLDRHRAIESQVLPALQTRLDPALLQQMEQLLKQVDEAETFALEVSTPVETFEPQLRMETLDRATRTLEVRVFLQELRELHKLQLLRKELPPQPPVPPAGIPTGSI